jgi:hypothetical protein
MSSDTTMKRRSFFSLKKPVADETPQEATSSTTLLPAETAPKVIVKKKSFFRKLTEKFRKTPVVPPVITITSHDEEYSAAASVKEATEAKMNVEAIWKEISEEDGEDGNMAIVVVSPMIDMDNMMLGGELDEYTYFVADVVIESKKEKKEVKRGKGKEGKEIVEEKKAVEEKKVVEAKEIIPDAKAVEVKEAAAAPIAEEKVVDPAVIVEELMKAFALESPATSTPAEITAEEPITRKSTLAHYRRVSAENLADEEDAFAALELKTLTRQQKKKAAYRAKKKAAKHVVSQE